MRVVLAELSTSGRLLSTPLVAVVAFQSSASDRRGVVAGAVVALGAQPIAAASNDKPQLAFQVMLDFKISVCQPVLCCQASVCFGDLLAVEQVCIDGITTRVCSSTPRPGRQVDCIRVTTPET